jgi:hypothetical protein
MIVGLYGEEVSLYHNVGSSTVVVYARTDTPYAAYLLGTYSDDFSLAVSLSTVFDGTTATVIANGNTVLSTEVAPLYESVRMLYTDEWGGHDEKDSDTTFSVDNLVFYSPT